MSRDAAVFVSGMCDLRNYGDLLFPLLAQRRLGELGYRTVPVAPTAGRGAIEDALETVAIRDMLDPATPVAGVVVGGGYIVHANSLEFLEEYETQGTGSWSGAGLWLGATLAACLHDVPIAWNAPGVPHPFSARQHGLIDAALRASDHVAVRDMGSARLLQAPQDITVRIVPDTAAELPRLWPRPSLAGHYRALLQRKGIAPEARLMAIHVRNRSMAGLPPAALGAQLGAFARAHGLLPMLVAVGRSHDDAAVARGLAPYLGMTHLLLDDPLSLREITAALAYSALYLGASLHGYIVSAAYDVPGVLLARPAYQKFGGFLEHTGRRQDLARSWDEAFRIGAERAREPAMRRVPASVTAAIDAHWGAIDAALRDAGSRSGERAGFARAMLRFGLAAEGPGWAMGPFASRAPRGAPTGHDHPVPARP